MSSEVLTKHQLVASQESRTGPEVSQKNLNHQRHQRKKEEGTLSNLPVGQTI